MAAQINTLSYTKKAWEKCKAEWDKLYRDLPTSYPPLFKPRLNLIRWARRQNGRTQR